MRGVVEQLHVLRCLPESPVMTGPLLDIYDWGMDERQLCTWVLT